MVPVRAVHQGDKVLYSFNDDCCKLMHFFNLSFCVSEKLVNSSFLVTGQRHVTSPLLSSMITLDIILACLVEPRSKIAAFGDIMTGRDH